MPILSHLMDIEHVVEEFSELYSVHVGFCCDLADPNTSV